MTTSRRFARAKRRFRSCARCAHSRVPLSTANARAREASRHPPKERTSTTAAAPTASTPASACDAQRSRGAAPTCTMARARPSARAYARPTLRPEPATGARACTWSSPKVYASTKAFWHLLTPPSCLRPHKSKAKTQRARDCCVSRVSGHRRFAYSPHQRHPQQPREARM
eukprot:6202770-Pleurochrysis_carterae.AAC.1